MRSQGGVELSLDYLLEIHVDGEGEVVAGHGLGDVIRQLLARVDVYGIAVSVHEPAHGVHPASFRDYAPERVHVVGLPARLSAQGFLVGELDPALADDGVRVQAIEGRQLELVLGYGPGVPENVGGEPALRVATDPVVVHGDALEFPGAFAHVRHRVAARVLLYQDGAVLATGLYGCVVAGQHRLGVGLDRGGQFLHHVAGDLVRDHGYVEAWHVVGEDLAVAVVDHAPLGGNLDVGVLRGPRRERVVLAREDLQIPEPRAEDEENGRYEHGQGDHPHLHVALGHRRRLHALLRGVGLLLLGHRQPEQPLPPPLRSSGHYCFETFSAWTTRRSE